MAASIRTTSARHSISLSHSTVDEVPYSPHHSPSLPKPLRSNHLSLPASRRATRITLTSTLSSACSDSKDHPPHYSELDSSQHGHHETPPAQDFPPDELAQLEAAWSWFHDTLPQGKLGVIRRDHMFDPAIAPYFMGYSSASNDWDALVMYDAIDHQNGKGTMSFEKEGGPPIPRRVLDIGCGMAAHWCLHMVQAKGWESTQFVGLDLAPVVVSNSMLAFEHASRLSFVQHNFLEGLPFDGARFNYVRVSGVAIGMPEHKWEDLIEDIVRVCAPGAIVEIIDLDFKLFLPSSSPPDSPSLSSEAATTLHEALELVFAKRFLNTATLSPVRPALAINCAKTTISDRRTALPSFPPRPDDIPSGEVKTEPEQDRARVLLHAYAERLDAASQTLASDLAFVRLANRPQAAGGPLDQPSLEEMRTVRTSGVALSSFSSAPSSGSPNYFKNPVDARVREKTRPQLEREVRDAVANWSEDLVERAGVARLVEKRWGWECEFDHVVEEVLEAYLPVFSQRLQEYEREEDKWGQGEVDLEVEFRRNQIVFAKREGEIELRGVRKRLGRLSRKSAALERGNGELGTLAMYTWVSKV